MAHVHPVISVDVADLKSCYKGIIFIYSGLTGNDEASILVFGISGGNEDITTWNAFNSLFAKACPSVLLVKEGHAYSKFVFVSDRDITNFYPISVTLMTSSRHRYHHQLSEDVCATK